MTQDTRLLPQNVTEAGALDRDYGYDGVGNVTAITDHLAGNIDSVAMTYDAANRLRPPTQRAHGAMPRSATTTPTT